MLVFQGLLGDRLEKLGAIFPELGLSYVNLLQLPPLERSTAICLRQ